MAENATPGPTPLHRAAYAGHAEVCALLLEHNADPMARDPDGDTAIHLAVMSDNLETCRAILDHGQIDFAAVNNAGKTAMEIALERADDDIIAALLAAGAPEPVHGSDSARLPLVSADARFLTFEDVPEPAGWLRAQITERSKEVRIPADRLSLRWAPLVFWPGAFLLAMRKMHRDGPSEQFALVWPEQDFVMLDWTNEPIYGAAERHAPLFDDVNVLLWCRFFFHFVRGMLGRFRIVEGIDEIIWTDEADDAAREAVMPHLRPLQVLERPAEDRVVLSATVVFKNALFRTKVLLATRRTEIETEDGDGTESFSRGQSRLFDEELLLEEQPFHVDGAPTRFG